MLINKLQPLLISRKMKLKNIVLVYILFSICFMLSCADKKEANPVTQEKISEMKTNDQEQVLRHVVIFKFKDESSEEDVNRLNESFIRLGEEISVIKDFEWGLNDSPEDFHQGFTHCYLVKASLFLREAVATSQC